jgi:hypothetical protein
VARIHFKRRNASGRSSGSARTERMVVGRELVVGHAGAIADGVLIPASIFVFEQLADSRYIELAASNRNFPVTHFCSQAEHSLTKSASARLLSRSARNSRTGISIQTPRLFIYVL